MIRLSPPAFAGSHNAKDLLTALLRRRAAGWVGQNVPDVRSPSVLAGGHLTVGYEKGAETAEVVAALTGQRNPATART